MIPEVSVEEIQMILKLMPNNVEITLEDVTEIIKWQKDPN